MAQIFNPNIVNNVYYLDAEFDRKSIRGARVGLIILDNEREKVKKFRNPYGDNERFIKTLERKLTEEFKAYDIDLVHLLIDLDEAKALETGYLYKVQSDPAASEVFAALAEKEDLDFFYFIHRWEFDRLDRAGNRMNAYLAAPVYNTGGGTFFLTLPAGKQKRAHFLLALVGGIVDPTGKPLFTCANMSIREMNQMMWRASKKKMVKENVANCASVFSGTTRDISLRWVGVKRPPRQRPAKPNSKIKNR